MPLADPVFHLNGVNTRRAEPRNTPTVINAAYSRRMFWDVRARNLFNAVNAEGASDPNSKVLRANGLNSLQSVLVRMDNASLASQAVAPRLSSRRPSPR